jgi:hypothetical protein
MLQQSYYGDADGSSWNGQPWCYNPVQGGSWQTSYDSSFYVTVSILHHILVMHTLQIRVLVHMRAMA